MNKKRREDEALLKDRIHELEKDFEDVYRTSVSELEKSAKDHTQETRALTEKSQGLQAGISKLQDKIAQLNSEVTAKKDLQDQLEVVTNALEEAKKDGVLEKTALSEKVASLEANLAHFKDIDCTKRQLEKEMTERKRLTAALKAEVEASKAALRERGTEHKRLQSRLRAAEAEVKSITKAKDTAAKASRSKLQDEKTKHMEELNVLKTNNKELDESLDQTRSVVKQRDTAITELKVKVDTLSSALESKGQDMTELQNQLRDLEAEKESLAALHRIREAALQDERKKHMEDMEKLEAQYGTLQDSLEAHSERLWEANEGIGSLATTAEERRTALEEQEAQHAKAVDLLETRIKDLLTGRDSAMAEKEKQARRAITLQDDISKLNQALTTVNETLMARKEEIQRLGGKIIDSTVQLEKAEECRREIQNTADNRILELEAMMRQRNEQLEIQARGLQEAEETLKKDLVVEIRKRTAKLRQELAMHSLHEKENQQENERFIDFVRSQLLRKIEDERHREPDDAIKGATMEGLQEILRLKLDYLGDELTWYKQKFEEKERLLKEADDQLRQWEPRFVLQRVLGKE